MTGRGVWSTTNYCVTFCCTGVRPTINFIGMFKSGSSQLLSNIVIKKKKKKEEEKIYIYKYVDLYWQSFAINPGSGQILTYFFFLFLTWVQWTTKQFFDFVIDEKTKSELLRPYRGWGHALVVKYYQNIVLSPSLFDIHIFTQSQDLNGIYMIFMIVSANKRQR